MGAVSLAAPPAPAPDLSTSEKQGLFREVTAAAGRGPAAAEAEELQA